jgi:hypothetical protein
MFKRRERLYISTQHILSVCSLTLQDSAHSGCQKFSMFQKKLTSLGSLLILAALIGTGCQQSTQTSTPSPSGSVSNAAPCGTDRLARTSGNLFAVIEVGSKGVKGKVVQELAALNEDGSKLQISRKEKLEDRNVTAVDPASKAQVVEAVRGMFSEIQERYNIPCEQIVIFGSSGLAQKAPHKDVLIQDIQQAIGRKVQFISSDEEAMFVFNGMVPAWRRQEVLLIDIGSGNTKGGFLNSAGKEVPFAVPFGTVTFTKEIEKLQGAKNFYLAAQTVKQQTLMPEIQSELQRKPGIESVPRIYLAGGISWALFTLTRPCTKEFTVKDSKQERVTSFAPISPEDINTFYYNTSQNQSALFSPNLSQCNAEQKQEVQEEIANIKETFTVDNLVAGAEILRAFAEKLGFDKNKKPLFFARSAKDALPIGYLKRQLDNLELDAPK